MKVLIDVNLSPGWTSVLAAHQIEGLHWTSVGDPRAADAELMGYARDHGYVVFTHVRCDHSRRHSIFPRGKFRAKQFREHLRAADVTRPRLYEESATLLQVNFRSCRDTGITWLALAGLEVVKIQRRAGHKDIATTLGYVEMAEDLSGKVGVPFGPLPSNLLAPGGGHNFWG